jgi:hypothetical protein
MKKYYLILILLVYSSALTFSQEVVIEAPNLGKCEGHGIKSESYNSYQKIRITRIEEGKTLMCKANEENAIEIPKEKQGLIDLTQEKERNTLLIANKKNFKLTIYFKDKPDDKCEINFEIKEAPQSTPVDTLELYLKEVIFPTLRLKYKPYEEASKGDTTYIFLDQNLNPLRNTQLPSCANKASYFKVFVVFDSKKADLTKAEFFAQRKKSDQSRIATGNGTIRISAQATDEVYKDWKFLASEPKGPFSNVDIKIVLYQGKSQTYFTEKVIPIESCEQPYHVSILGGYYYSSLNDPSNITVEKIPSDPGNYSLFGDNTQSQRAIAIMAVFYPRPRYPDYEHKSLSFMQKWGVAFGTKLTQNLFNDLLLGLNYEVSKGLGFTSGVHYGSHAVIRGYENFEFGKTRYGGDNPQTIPSFSNGQLSQQWDFGWFAGVTIDLRVVGAIFNNRGKLSDEQK